MIKMNKTIYELLNYTNRLYNRIVKQVSQYNSPPTENFVKLVRLVEFGSLTVLKD